MTRDYLKPITRLIADGEKDKIPSAVHRSVAEIQGEIAALRQQEALLRGLLAFYAPSQGIEAPPQKVPTVSTSVADDGLSAHDRSRLVRDAALELARGGQTVLSAGDVVEALARKGVVFSVKRPNSMAGTILSGMPEFARIGQNRFSYVASDETTRRLLPFDNPNAGENDEGDSN